MADYINDNELDELNAIYEQKRQSQKQRTKKVKNDKSPEPENKPEKEKKFEKQKTEKPVKADKATDKAKDKKPIKEKSEPEQTEGKNKNLPHIISIIVSGAVFFSIAILLLVLPRPTVSELENRKLTEFPKFSWEYYWSGGYTEQISEFYNDTVPYRDDFKRLGAAFRSLFGINIEGNAIVGPVEQVTPDETAVTTASTRPIAIVTPAPKDESSDAPESKDESTPATDGTDDPPSSAESTPAPVPPQQFVTPSDPDADVLMQAASNIVYYSHGTLYAGSLYNGRRSNAEYFANTVAALDSRINAKLYFMPILTQNTFVTPAELNTGTYTEHADATYLSNLIGGDVEVLDIYNALAEHSSEDIYFLRDTHWQQLGAYYATKVFADAAGVKYPALSEYTEKQRDSIGSVYTFTDFEALEGVYETFTYYIPPNDFEVDYYDEDYNYQFTYPLMPENDYSAKGFYSLYMVADEYIKHITTDADNGKKLVVLKDDYLSAAVPCLTSSYEEIFVIDVRHCNFNVANFINEQDIDDVLFGLTISNALSDVGSYLDYLQY
ncbi:MAG: hypothetical protein J1E39_01405 [Eubacterium sp.]|nr:hypothetical protein [Eubacterium sp.]